MSAIEKIIRKLSAYPGVKFGRLGDRLEIAAPNPGGFAISFREGRPFAVAFGPNERRFDSEEEALEYLAFGLTSRCRLRTVARGRPYRWIVEQRVGDGWRAMSGMGLPAFPFWRRKTETLQQNHLFD